jgi:large subunit ribosomal protein L23
MKLKALLTEKSLEKAKNGKYSFWVDKGLTKYQIKKLINETFGVNVIDVRTVNIKGEIKRTNRGSIKTIKPQKKAIVTLKEKEKIELFEEKKNKK